MNRSNIRGRTFPRIRSSIATSIALGLVSFASISFGVEADDEQRVNVPRRLTPKSGNVILELRGDTWGFPTSAWLVSPSTGKETFLARPETYIYSGAISDDGRCIALHYHVSSGGYAEAFVRWKGGAFKRLFESHYADKLIASGKVDGLSGKDIPRLSHRNTNHGISLASSPNRFVFDIGNGELLLTYSVDKHRVTGWDRVFFSGRYPAGIGLRELSGRRGFALVAQGNDDEAIPATTLCTFPNVSIDRRASKIHLRRATGDGERVELTAKVDELGTAREDEIGKAEAVWNVELSGKGKEFDALTARLSRMKEEKTNTTKADWPDVTKFSVIGKAPVGFSVARNPEEITRTLPGKESGDPATIGGKPSIQQDAGLSTERTLLLGKAKEAIEKGDYREAEKIYQQLLTKDPTNTPP